MVAVAPHKLGELCGDELFKRDVAPRRCIVPLVEALVPYEQPHLVAEFKKLRRGGVVGGADGVHAHVDERLEFAAHRRAVERHTENAKVGMQTHSLELHTAAVQVKTVVAE